MAGTPPQAWQEVAFVSISRYSATVPETIECFTMADSVDLPQGDYPWESVANLAGGRIGKQSPEEDGEFTLDIYPRKLEKTLTISGIDGDTTTITVDTSTAHGLAAGDKVVIDDTTNYNGLFTVATISDADTFTISDTAHDLAAEAAGQISHTDSGLFQHFNGGTYDAADPISTDTSWGSGINRARDRFRVAIMLTDDANVKSANEATSATDSVALRFVAMGCIFVSHKASYTDKILKVTCTFKYPAMNKAGTVKMHAWQYTNDGDTSPLLVLPKYDDEDSWT